MFVFAKYAEVGRERAKVFHSGRIQLWINLKMKFLYEVYLGFSLNQSGANFRVESSRPRLACSGSSRRHTPRSVRSRRGALPPPSRGARQSAGSRGHLRGASRRTREEREEAAVGAAPGPGPGGRPGSSQQQFLFLRRPRLQEELPQVLGLALWVACRDAGVPWRWGGSGEEQGLGARRADRADLLRAAEERRRSAAGRARGAA